MSTQTNPNASSKNRWIWIGGLVALLVVLGVALAVNRSSNRTAETASSTAPVVAPPANTPAPAQAVAGSFEEAGKTWTEVAQARAQLDTAIEEEKLDQVHHAALKIRDQVRKLPEHSAALPEEQRKQLDLHVQHVDQLAGMLDEAGDAKNVRSTHQHHVALNEALDQIRKLYPEGALPAKGGMGGMSGGMMDDDKMSGMGGGMHGGGMMDDEKMGGMSNAPGGEMGSGMMDDKMGGMGGSSNAPKSGMGGMGGGMMDDDKMGGMGGGMPGDKKTPAKKAPAKKDPAHPAPAPQGGGGMGGHM